MSRKNSTSVTDDDRHLHAVTDDPGQQNAPTTEDKVHAALAAGPGSTTATLAMAAGVGRSTAAKILARWERDGTAIRTAGDSPRNPSTWTLAPSGSNTAAPDTDQAQPDATATPSTDQTTDHASDIDDNRPAEETVAAASEVSDSAAEDATAAESPETTLEADDTATVDASGPAADAESDSTIPLPDTATMDPVDGATEPKPSPVATPAAPEPTDTVPTDKERLPKGGLRALVEEYLTDHPGEDFGPAKIGQVLGRSGGAVNNALEKLVADGYAIKTCEAPKRFVINPDRTDVSAAPGGTE